MTQRNWLGNTGAWSDPTQWSGGVLPGTADIAAFGPSGTFTVNFATTATVVGLSEGSSTGTLDIASGFLDLTGIGGNSDWDGLILQSGGAMVVQSGTVLVNGTLDETGGSETIGLGARLNLNNDATIDGELAGAGALGVGGAVTLDNNAIITIGAILMATTGTLVLGGNQSYAGAYTPGSGSLMLHGDQIILSGHDNFGDSRIVGPGTIAVDGSADLPATSIVGAGATLFDAGTITTDGPFALSRNSGDQAKLVVDPGALFEVLTDTRISTSSTGTLANGQILNDGLLEKAAGVLGQSTNVQAPITNNGTLRVTLGTLLLTAPGSVLGGTIDGAGTLSIGSMATLAAGAVVNVATLNVGYQAVLALGANENPFGDVLLTPNGTIALQGNTLTVQGQGMLDGKVDAPGTLLIGGVYDFNGFTATGGTITMHDQGFITQSGPLVLGSVAGDKVGFQIDAGSVYDIVASDGVSGGTYIYSFNNGTTLDGLILNNGLFEITANGGGSLHIDSLFSNNTTGTILVARGTLDWTQGLVNDGVGTINGTAIIGGTPTAGGLQSSTGHFGTLTVAGGILNITGPVNAKSTIDFAGPGELIVNTTSAFAATVIGFGAGDTIDFPNAPANSYSTSANFVTLLNVVNGTSTTLDTFQMLIGAGFALTEDGNGGSKFVSSVPGNVGLLPFHTPVPFVSWVPGGTATGDWFTGTNWSNGVSPNGVVNVTVSSTGGTVNFNGAATVNALTWSGTTLNMSGGRFQVTNGGTLSGFITQTGGVIESVTGLTLSSAADNEGASAALQSDSGTLVLQGTFNAAGTITGPSTVQVTGTLTPIPGGLINVGTLLVNNTFVPYAGETITDDLILLGGSNMPLFGSTLTVAGQAQLGGTVAGSTHPNEIIVTGTADASGLQMLGTGDLLQIDGSAKQTGGLLVMSAPGAQLNVQPNATYDLQSDTGINILKGSVVNAGLFEKTGGAGLSELQEPFISTGTVMVNTGTLWLNSPTVDLAGTVGGEGTLQTGNGGNATVTLEPATFINVGTFNAGNMVLNGDQKYLGFFNGSGSIALQGHNFQIGGDTTELAGTVSGPGVLSLTNTADLTGLVVSGTGVTISDTGTVTQSANVSLGGTGTDHVTLAIAAGHSYNVLTDSFVGGVFGAIVTGTIANAGLFEKTAGGGNTTLFAALDNTGTVAVQHGTLTVGAASINDGRIVVNGALMVSAALIADTGKTGTIEMTPTATLVANAPIAATQTIVYDPGGLIAISQIGNFSAAIANFTPGDTIDLVNTLANRESYAGGVLTMTETSGTLINPVGTLAMPGLANPAGITLANDGNSGTFIVEAPCFAAGTRIETSRGPVAVEALGIGDEVINLRGECLKVVWLGHRRVDCRRHPRPWDVQPVRVLAGAFGAGRPRHEVRLSPDHAVYVDGALIPVRYLINDATVVQEAAASVTYWHVELCRHDILLAEGLPVESYLDTGNRQAFANGGAPVALHPDFAHQAWRAKACAPLVVEGARVAAVRARLLARAEALGHDKTDAADPRLRVGRWVLRGRGTAAGHVRFDLPRDTSEVRLRSRSAVPAHLLAAAAADHRRLGVAVARLWLDDRLVPLTDACLGAGWHAPEAGLRWTDGDATIATGGARLLTVHTLPLLRYWTGSGAAAGGDPYSRYVATG